jgi:phosphinothricin tripeptide acetyl hydrolase
MSARGIAVVRAHLARIAPAASLAERRAQYDRAERVFAVPPDTRVTAVTAPGPAEWIEPSDARAGAAVLYLHGGGYVLGSPRSHRHLAAAVGGAARAAVLLPDYRLAPEHPFPAAVDDAVAAYRWLLDRGHASGRTALAGDSAGGGLVVATLLALREQGLGLPAAAVCISPWVDLTGSGASYRDRAERDPIVARDRVMEMARAYLGGADARAPLASPLFADLTGLPPLLVQVGSEEVLHDDAVGLADRARAAGVPATLQIWPEMVHVWHWFLPWLDEAQAAVDTAGAFIQRRIA